MSSSADEPLDRHSDARSEPDPASTPGATSDDLSPPDTEADSSETVTGSAAAEPDLGFTLGDSPNIAEQSRNIMHRVARTLSAEGPAGWQRLDAAFAATVVVGTGTVIYSDENQRPLAHTTPTPEIMSAIGEQRRLSAGYGDGPWWRLLLTCTAEGRIEVDYDFGAEPFPDDQLFAPEAYHADLDVYPRQRLPVWLAAYLRHGGRQLRPPEAAATQGRVEHEVVAGTEPDTELPPLPQMTARWAVLSAAFVAARSRWGPRLMPGVRWFEGAQRSGSSLYALPGGRAVLSGGRWDAAELDAAYNRGEPLPDLYRGAPDWLADPVLNHRAARGLLTFCYWWDGRRWQRGDSPDPDEFADAIPGVWTVGTVAQVVTGLLGAQPADRQAAAVEDLVTAAEAGVVTRELLVEVFGDDGAFDIDNAYYQLLLGAVTARDPIAAADALAVVARYLTDSGTDTSAYPVAELRADRVSAGWMVYVPVDPGEIAIGRAIFYVADDGVLEHSSSSVAPSAYLPGFAARARERNRAMI